MKAPLAQRAPTAISHQQCQALKDPTRATQLAPVTIHARIWKQVPEGAFIVSSPVSRLF